MKLIDINPENINQNYIYFNEPIQNTIINESRFIRIIYSTPDIILNGIHVLFKLTIDNLDKQYNKNIIYYDIELNREIIQKINNIEELILNKYKTNKEKSFNLLTQLESGNIKLFSENIEKRKILDIILKISGLWENDTHYGITYKFLSIND